jgi:hypothetical protein
LVRKLKEPHILFSVVEFVLEKAETMMLVASIIGAIAGIIFNASVNPINNYFIFMIIFAIIGIGVALLVLAALTKVYEWAIR